MNASSRPDVSTVIGVKNGVATLQQCLDNIAAQDFGSNRNDILEGEQFTS